MKKAALFAVCIVSFLPFSSIAQGTASEYKLINKIHYDGDGGWDLLTSYDAKSRLFVSHSSQVQVY